MASATTEYLEALLPAVRHSFDKFQPDMVFYIGGADPYRDDQLGGLDISMEGLKERDKVVFEEASKRKIPVVTTLAGGYARRLEDTVQIHANTICAALEVAENSHKHVRQEVSVWSLQKGAAPSLRTSGQAEGGS